MENITTLAEHIQNMRIGTYINFKAADDPNTVYGIKRTSIFDEPNGVLIIGAYGTEYSKMWNVGQEIGMEDIDDIAEQIKEYLKANSTEDTIYIDE